MGERDGAETMAEQHMHEVAAVRLCTSMCSVRLFALAMYGCLGSGRGGVEKLGTELAVCA